MVMTSCRDYYSFGGPSTRPRTWSQRCRRAWRDWEWNISTCIWFTGPLLARYLMVASKAHVHARSRMFLWINPSLSPWPTPTLFFTICYLFHVIYYYLFFRWHLEMKCNKTPRENAEKNIEKTHLKSRRIGWPENAILSLRSAETTFSLMKLTGAFGLITPRVP